MQNFVFYWFVAFKQQQNGCMMQIQAVCMAHMCMMKQTCSLFVICHSVTAKPLTSHYITVDALECTILCVCKFR